MATGLKAAFCDVRSTIRNTGPRDWLRTLRVVRSLLKLTTLEGRADPYPLFQRAMRIEPIIYVPPFNWLVLGYSEAAAALRDPRLSSNLQNRVLRPGYPTERLKKYREEHAAARIRDWMLFKDGDDHVRLRSLVGQAFTRKVVEGLRSRIEELANRLLDEAAMSGHIELIQDFAYPLPMTVICDLLGVPREDRPRFGEWTRKLARFLDPAMNAEDNADIIRHGDEAWGEFAPYFATLVHGRRQNLGDDLLSELIQASDGADRLSVDELLAQCTLLLVAGHETTANLIGNGLLALLQNPGELAKLRSNPSLIKGAVEELLRYWSPVSATVRVALEPLEIGRTKIPLGHDVLIAIGAANRDPRQFPDPERLDVSRTDIKHLAFSGGPHFCLGAPLARLEAEVAFATLIRRFESIECEMDVPQWRETITLRGLKALPLSVRAA